MKNYLFTSLAVIACVSTVQASPHIDGMKEMTELLRQSVAIMKSCKDAESTKAGTAKLIELRDQAAEIGKKINGAGQPSQEDLAAMMPLLNDVMTLSKQGEEEIARIKAANLFTPELAAALNAPGDAVPSEEAPAADKKDEAPAPKEAPAADKKDAAPAPKDAPAADKKDAAPAPEAK